MGKAVRTAKSAASAEAVDLSHNLQGQRLGRKGRDTRNRIIEATERLLAGPADTAITLSAVAREASLAMTTLYLYFGDLSELLGAVLEPVMESAESTYVDLIRSYWPDEALADRSLGFVHAFYDFWQRNTRILHLRNHYAENGDERMGRYRVMGATVLVQHILRQMEAEGAAEIAPHRNLATVLLTGMERTVTVATDPSFPTMLANAAPLSTEGAPAHDTDGVLKAQARVLELVIIEGRRLARGARTG